MNVQKQCFIGAKEILDGPSAGHGQTARLWVDDR